MGIMDNLLGGAGSAVDDVTGLTGDDGSGGVPFETFLTPGDHNGEGSFGATCQPDTFTPILTFRVPAGVRYRFGSGAAKYEANQGYIYVHLKNGSDVEVTGTLRLKQVSASGRQSRVVKDLDSEKLHGSKSDRTQQQPLPEQSSQPKVKQDSFLVVEFQPDSDSSVVVDDGTNTEFNVPVTEYDLTQSA